MAQHAGTKRTFAAMNGAQKSSDSSPCVQAETVPRMQTPRASPESGGISPSKSTQLATELARPLQKIKCEPDSSIVLIGVRGVGKSSLGFLAATAYNRRLIESEKAFLDATGSCPNAFRKAQGTIKYHKKHSEVLTGLLESHSKNAVIVCTFQDLENTGARLLQSFAKSHPVIYVTRDPDGIQSYLRVWSSERIQDLIRASESLLRKCSNHEFFNLSENTAQQAEGQCSSTQPLPRPLRANGPFLTLKRIEHDFLKLLRNIIGDHDRGRSHQSAYPLSQISVEQLEYTSAVIISVEDVIAKSLDLDVAQAGADAIEFRISNHLRHSPTRKLGKQGFFNLASEAFAMLKRSTILPIIVTVSDTDHTAESPEVSYAELLDFCLRLGPEYCSLDLSLDEAYLQAFMARRGQSKVIGKYVMPQGHPANWESEECVGLYEKAQRLGCDLVKIVLHPKSISDNFAVSSFHSRMLSTHGPNGPKLIAYCMGKDGRTSMCFNSVLTSVAPINSYESLVPDAGGPEIYHLTARERNLALCASFVQEPLRFFIYGSNVSYSLSPPMHNAAYQACGMSHSYRTHSASTLDDFAALVREVDFGGAAIVQPFKTTALPMMDILSPHAKAIGALNTVIPLRDESIIKDVHSELGIFRNRNRTGPVKALYGDNTDWIGIRACIRRGLSPANTVRPQSTGLVCGAGGMARAAIYAMMSLGVRSIFVCNRTRQHTEHLAAHYNQLIQSNAIVELSQSNAAATSVTALESFDSEWPKDVRHPTMIVSCIPTQTADDRPTDFVLPKEWLGSRTGGVVVELAYMPIVTPLVTQIREESRKGWILMDGLDMLPEQAFAQFELFTGRRAPRKLMRDQVFKHYSEDEYPPHGALNTDSPTRF